MKQSFLWKVSVQQKIEMNEHKIFYINELLSSLYILLSF